MDGLKASKLFWQKDEKFNGIKPQIKTEGLDSVPNQIPSTILRNRSA